MKTNTVSIQRAAILEAAILVCHALKKFGVFRARDVRLYIELFSNWIDPTSTPQQQPISNTQLGRYLKEQIRGGHLKSGRHKQKQIFRLTTLGFPKLCKSLVARNYSDRRDQCFFVLMFLTDYLRRYLREQAQLPGSTNRQLARQLLDITKPRLFIETQLYYLKEKQAAMAKQEKIFRELEQALPELDLAVTDAVDIIDQIQGATEFFMHQYVSAKKFLKDVDRNRIVSELQEGINSRRKYLLHTASESLKLHEEQLIGLQRSLADDS